MACRQTDAEGLVVSVKPDSRVDVFHLPTAARAEFIQPCAAHLEQQVLDLFFDAFLLS